MSRRPGSRSGDAIHESAFSTTVASDPSFVGAYSRTITRQHSGNSVDPRGATLRPTEFSDRGAWNERGGPHRGMRVRVQGGHTGRSFSQGEEIAINSLIAIRQRGR